MCLNCGCHRPNDDHGNPVNITAADLRRAGEANGQSMRTGAVNILETLDEMEGGDAVASAMGTRSGSGLDDGHAERGTPATES
jgi:hypothetical protein